MPFILKNAGATYQRASTTILHVLIVKSKERSEHCYVLRKFFEQIRKYKLRLNPKKCAFRVTSGRLLGFVVSQKGIEVDPAKAKAILNMPPPCTEKELRGFLDRLQYINRFICQLTDVCEPIFKLLKKNQPKDWNEQCQATFERVKEYLQSPPVLAPPISGCPLLLYLSTSDIALGFMLAQYDDHGKERAIYYLSKKMLDYELKYTTIEKTCLALVWVTKEHFITQKELLEVCEPILSNLNISLYFPTVPFGYPIIWVTFFKVITNTLLSL